MLREAKRGMQRRIGELCAFAAVGKLEQEAKRCFPDVDGWESDQERMRTLLLDLLDRALPSHWVD